MSRGKAIVLTDKVINAMTPGEEIWDSREPGLHVRMGVKGRSFLYFYTTAAGVRRKPSMKRGISLTMAREVAKEWADQAAAGKDPFLLREEERSKAPPPTLGDLEVRWEMEAKRAEQFWKDIEKNNRFFEMKKSEKGAPFAFIKPNTITNYRLHWRNIITHFGADKILTSLTSTDLCDFHRTLSLKTANPNKGRQLGGPRKANQLIVFFGTLLQAAVIWGLMEEAESARFLVMFKRVNRNPEYGRERYITQEEMPKVHAALNKLKSPLDANGKEKNKRVYKEDLLRANFIEILFATGSRKGEFMTAKLSWIDWTRKEKVIRLPQTKIRAQIVPLADKILTLLKERTDQWVANGRKPEEDWVVPSPRKYGQPLGSPRKGWIAFLKLAGLDPSITMHTIRHTIVTQGLHAAGLSLQEAGDIVGHSSLEITEKYAHKNMAKRVASMNKVTAAIDAMMAGTGTAEYNDDDVLPDYIKRERAEAKLLNEVAVTSAH